MKTYFFGSGKIGKRILNTAREYGIVVNGFIDNNQALWGTFCEGVQIYSPDILKEEEADVYITCLDYKTIRTQLLSMGIGKEHIIYGYNLNNYLLFQAVRCGYYRKDEFEVKREDNNNLLIDLNNGMVLGGVESWAYQMSEYWKEMGYNGYYLVGDINESNRCNKNFPIVSINFKDNANIKEVIEETVNKIIQKLPCTVISNFPFYTFWAACIVKSMYPDDIKVVSVQHSDEHIYYLGYPLWQKYIDKCLVISTRINDKLVSLGMDKSKITRLDWEISCNPHMERTWSDTGRLKLGYAGRVTTIYKRVDNLVVIAEKLRKRGIDFVINVAGEGEFLPALKETIENNNLTSYFDIRGFVKKEDIPYFWQEQDIGICCSDKEGRSISISEAMANGAVTVVTDVSGMRDDISDGVNGFIVPIGDMDALVEKIEYLDKHRDELARIGQNAHDTFLHRQLNFDKRGFWDGVLQRN